MRVRTEAQRERIIEAATGVFLEMGFERATMSEIANRVGGSKATLYGYFPSKYSLFTAVIFSKMGAAASFIENLPSRAGEAAHDVLIDFGQQYLKTTQSPEARALKSVIAGMMAQPNESASSFWDDGPKKLLDVVENYLRNATSLGKLRVDEPSIAAKQLLSLYEAEPNWMPTASFPTMSDSYITSITTRAVNTFLAHYGIKL